MGAEGRGSLAIELARPGSPLWERAARFHYEQYLALGWIDPNPEGIVLEYEPWSDGDVAFHVAFDETGAVAGTIRTILGAIDTLPVAKTCPDVEVATIGTESCVEFASLVVDRRTKGLEVAGALYAAAFAWTVHRGARWIVALVDRWLLDLFVDEYKVPFAAIGPPTESLGGTPIPVAVTTTATARSAAAGNPSFWRVVSSGLDPAVANALASGEVPEP